MLLLLLLLVVLLELLLSLLLIVLLPLLLMLIEGSPTAARRPRVRTTPRGSFLASKSEPISEILGAIYALQFQPPGFRRVGRRPFARSP